MTLAKSVLAAVEKLRAMPSSCPETGADVVDLAALAQVADDLEYKAIHTAACESCATYRTVLDLCVASLPRPAVYGELPGWIAQLVAVADAAREYRDAEKYGPGDRLGVGRDALDAVLAKVEER